MKAKLDRYEEAIKDFDKAIENPSDNTIYFARFNKGVCLRKTGLLEQSIDELKKAVELKPDDANAHNHLGLSYFDRKNFEDAISEYSRAITSLKLEMNEHDESVREKAA